MNTVKGITEVGINKNHCSLFFPLVHQASPLTKLSSGLGKIWLWWISAGCPQGSCSTRTWLAAGCAPSPPQAWGEAAQPAVLIITLTPHRDGRCLHSLQLQSCCWDPRQTLRAESCWHLDLWIRLVRCTITKCYFQQFLLRNLLFDKFWALILHFLTCIITPSCHFWMAVVIFHSSSESLYISDCFLCVHRFKIYQHWIPAGTERLWCSGLCGFTRSVFFTTPSWEAGLIAWGLVATGTRAEPPPCWARTPPESEQGSNRGDRWWQCALHCTEPPGRGWSWLTRVEGLASRCTEVHSTLGLGLNSSIPGACFHSVLWDLLPPMVSAALAFLMLTELVVLFIITVLSSVLTVL